MVKHYPLMFEPIYKEMIWGGSRLNTIYNRQLPFNKTGESWDITCRPVEMGIIENGSAKGMTFEDYINRDRVGTLGSRIVGQERFPLLVKIIDANDVLSVQVHPDDKQLSPRHGEEQSGEAIQEWNPQDTGKNEMWYILVPPTDGQLIIGLKPGITSEALSQAYKNGTVEDCLNRLPVRAGDIVNIPAGLIHALTPGVMVAEVQQNSDITYRLYDFNRIGLDGKPRQLHVDEAIAVTDFEGIIPKTTIPGLSIKKDDCTLTYAIANPYFAVIKYELGASLEEVSDPSAFCVFTCVKGEAVIEVGEGSRQVSDYKRHLLDASVNLSLGRSVFIPAGLGPYNLRPKGRQVCVLLKSFAPDIQKDFISPLKEYGYTDNDITKNTAIDYNI